MDRITFELQPKAPFRLDLTAWVLRRRPNNSIDQWDGRTYRRVLVIAGEPLEIAVTQHAPRDHPLLGVTVTGPGLRHDSEAHVTSALNRSLGLQADLSGFYDLAEGGGLLAPLAERYRGLKPPRFPSLFETLVNAISCQQLTLTFGITLLTRLTGRYGLAVPAKPEARAFPRPEDLAGATPDALRALQFSRAKCASLTGLAEAIVSGRLDLGELSELSGSDAISRLCKLRGVGRWSAEYFLLRGLGRTNVFPGDDVGARQNLRRWQGIDEPLDYEGVRACLSKWSPYGGLVYFHLLLKSLDEGGFLSPL